MKDWKKVNRSETCRIDTARCGPLSTLSSPGLARFSRRNRSRFKAKGLHCVIQRYQSWSSRVLTRANKRQMMIIRPRSCLAKAAPAANQSNNQKIEGSRKYPVCNSAERKPTRQNPIDVSHGSTFPSGWIKWRSLPVSTLAWKLQPFGRFSSGGVPVLLNVTKGSLVCQRKTRCGRQSVSTILPFWRLKSSMRRW